MDKIANKFPSSASYLISSLSYGITQSNRPFSLCAAASAFFQPSQSGFRLQHSSTTHLVTAATAHFNSPLFDLSVGWSRNLFYNLGHF